MCAEKPWRFSCTILISSAQRPLLPWQKGRAPKEGDRLCLSPSLSGGFDLDISFPNPNHNPAKRTLLRRGWSEIIGLEQKEKSEHPIRILQRGPSVMIGSGKIQSYQWFSSSRQEAFIRNQSKEIDATVCALFVRQNIPSQYVPFDNSAATARAASRSAEPLTRKCASSPPVLRMPSASTSANNARKAV